MTDVGNGQGPLAEPVRADYAPGAGFYGVTIALAFGTLSLSAVASFGVLMLAVVMFVGLGVVAIAWLILAVVTAIRTRLRIGRRAWARWLGIPLIIVLCFGLVATSAPFRLRFELSREALQQAAQRVEAGEAVQAGDYGLFHIDYVSNLPNGIWFEDYSLGFIDPCGLAYASSGRPEIQFLEMDLGGGWWLACEDF